jgi:hypothetical protein
LYEVVEYQVVIRHVIDARLRTARGGIVHQLPDGRSVSLVAESTYWLPDAGRILTEVSSSD